MHSHVLSLFNFAGYHGGRGGSNYDSSYHGNRSGSGFDGSEWGRHNTE